MPLCPQITNTPVTVTQTGDFTVTSVLPLVGANKDGIATNISSNTATANQALADAAIAYTAAVNSLQPSAYAIQNPTTKQLSSIDATGLTVYSGASATTGARVVLNSLGLAGYDASNNATFSISASTGAAVFSGSVTGAAITGSSLNIAGKFVVNGTTGLMTATDATVTGTINASGGYIGSAANGWVFDSGGMLRNNAATTILYPTTSAGGNANTYAFYSDRGVYGSSLVVTSSSTASIYSSAGGLNVYLGITASNSGFVVNNSGAITTVGAITSSGTISTTGSITASLSITATQDVTAERDLFTPGHTTVTDAANGRVTVSLGRVTRSTASSQRYKEAITPIRDIDELDPKRLLDLPVRAFIYRSDYLSESDSRFGTLIPGFIAEEVDAIYPVAADYEDGDVESWNDRMIVPGLLALIQDLFKEIAILKGES